MMEINKKEDALAIITGKINDSIRELVLIETEANTLLVEWRQLCVNGKKGINCSVEIEKINQRDKDEQLKFDNLRKEKNEKLVELRKAYVEYLRNPNLAANDKKKVDVDLQRSSLISGTSKSSFDDVDFSRMFKQFLANEESNPIFIQAYIEPNKPKSKGKGKSEKKPKKPPKYDPASKLAKTPYYGEIYKGTLKGRPVCVKILSKLKEMEVSALRSHYEKSRNSSHTNLMFPICATNQPGESKIVIDFADGPYPSLDDFIKKENRYETMGFLSKLSYAKKICSALSWLHGNGLLHLRLKPTNILFTKTWKIKIADYGLDLPPVANAPEDWIKSGHAHYYPPELLADKNQKSKAVDVYSFGLVLYALLTETFPYTEAKTIEQLQKMIVENPVKLDPAVYPNSLITLLNKCLNKDPNQRPKLDQLASDQQWSEIYKDMIASGNKAGKEIWDKANKKNLKEIPWTEFAPIFWNELKVAKPKPEQEECVKTMLYLENSNVTYNNWMRFLTWFSPLRTGKEGEEFVNRVVQLLQAPWFYGREFDRTKSDYVMNEVLKDKKVMEKQKGKTPFLVRIAASQAEKYCLVLYAGPGKINHVPINSTDYDGAGIYKYITETAASKKWFATEQDRPYETDIFKKITILEAQDRTDGSTEEGKPRSVIQPNSVVGKTKYI